MVVAVPLLDRLRIDDVVGAIPAHLLAGIWSTIAVPLSNRDTSFATQVAGILAIGVLTFLAGLQVWAAIKATVGLRIPETHEKAGIDRVELGMGVLPRVWPRPRSLALSFTSSPHFRPSPAGGPPPPGRFFA